VIRIDPRLALLRRAGAWLRLIEPGFASLDEAFADLIDGVEDVQHSTSPLWRAFAEFEGRCPDFVENPRWQAAVEDGRAFLSEWSEQAESLGWRSEDLFGLTPIPEKPSPRFDPLSRYDRIGLVWLLQKLSLEIYDVVEDDESDEAIWRNPCFCGRAGIFAYEDSAGALIWYCGEHRRAQCWADARLTIDDPPVRIRKRKRHVLRCRGWVTRRVVGLTETTATIRTSAGGTTVYHRNGGGAP
jgi:hypothetical protein